MNVYRLALLANNGIAKATLYLYKGCGAPSSSSKIYIHHQGAEIAHWIWMGWGGGGGAIFTSYWFITSQGDAIHQEPVQVWEGTVLCLYVVVHNENNCLLRPLLEYFEPPPPPPTSPCRFSATRSPLTDPLCVILTYSFIMLQADGGWERSCIYASL